MILAIETSTPEASLALFDDKRDELVWQGKFSSDRAHNAVIFEPLATVLEMELTDGLSAIVVGTGPGSYSGIRVGIAVANGLSLARRVPCFGISSLAALPMDGDEADYRVIGDARRGEFFVVEVRAWQLLGEAEMMSSEALGRRLDTAGDGLSIYTTEAAVAARFAGQGAKLRVPTAVELARRALEVGAGRSAATKCAAMAALEPIYLRAPHITMPKKKGP